MRRPFHHHLRRVAVAEADAMAALARTTLDPLCGTLRLGIIPTLGP